MLKILKGKEIIDVDSIDNITSQYNKIIIDLGTGNGKFVYEQAINNSDNFYIGMDPIADNIIDYYKKKKKSFKRYNLDNTMFLISAIENIPKELFDTVDEIYVNFPWGSLLEGIVKGDHTILKNIFLIGKSNAFIHFTFTYSSIYEAGEIERRGLPELSIEYINTILRNKFMEAGLDIVDYGLLDENNLKSFGTLWSKRIYLGKDRVVYYIDSKVLK